MAEGQKEKQVSEHHAFAAQSQPDAKSKKGCVELLCELHNQARLISIVLGLFCAFLLTRVWNNELELPNFHLVCLYMSIVCIVSLLVGTFVTIPELYIPAVYIMRVSTITIIFYNMLLIIGMVNEVDMFYPDAKLRNKEATVAYLNQNFMILSHCLKLNVQALICLFVFGCLQLVTKDYHRLRTLQDFRFGRQTILFVIAQTQRFTRSKLPRQPIQEQFIIDDSVVRIKEQVVASNIVDHERQYSIASDDVDDLVQPHQQEIVDQTKNHQESLPV